MTYSDNQPDLPPPRFDEVMSPTLPLPPPSDRESLDRFVDWVAAVPRDARDDIRAAIRDLRDSDVFPELLHEALLTLPCTDTGRHALLLSIIGELGADSSVPVLERFVWLTDDEIFRDALRPEHGPCDFAPGGMLQARAAEMLVWVAGRTFEDGALRIVRDHPDTSVRVATVDALLFQREDSEDAVRWLTDLVRPEDAWAVGLPRRAEGMDPEAFDRLVEEHAARFPEDVELPAEREDESHVH